MREEHGLRKIFGPTRDEVTGERRRLHGEQFHDLYLSPNIFQMFSSRRMKWAEHVASVVKRRGEVLTGVWWGNLRETSHLEDPDTQGG